MKRFTFSNVLLVVLLMSLISCSSYKSKIENGSLNGIAFYDPTLKQTLYFRESLVKHKTWNGYPGGDYSSITSEEELNYTFDKDSKSGNINGQPFSVGFTNTNKTIVYLKYDGWTYILEKSWSEDPNKGITIFVLVLVFFGGVYLMYRSIKKIKSNNDKLKKQVPTDEKVTPLVELKIDKSQQLLNLQKLKEDGVITNDEFEKEKKNILNG